MEQVVLVDREDNELGLEEKMACHRYPVRLHRAISIVVLNGRDQMLITKRSAHKKTWPGFWTNACCSHPRKGESYEAAAKRRLPEELGFECNLEELFHFIYEAKFSDEWGEHELDHVFLGRHDGSIHANPEEVAEYKFVNIDELQKDMVAHPENYTPWFRKMFQRVLYHLDKA